MNLTSLIIWLVIGGVAGWLASIVMKTNSSQGLLMDIIVGIIGGLIGGWVLSILPGVAPTPTDQLNLGSLLTAFVGAVILLALIRLVRRGSI
jgi:uncharacterized membrane protein YeaQ/YmgE (transglycosylase-associated protein family)